MPRLKAYYDANTAAFRTPEEAKFEYVVLTPDALAAEVDGDARRSEGAVQRPDQAVHAEEQRQAAHILIAVKPDASDADKAAAKKKAEDLAAQAKANPAKFAELAKQYSDDPGSAAQGGDLGSNPRGTMVKAFDDAVFAMKPGEIVGPVQSDFGYHMIKLTGVTPAQTLSLDEAKGQIEADLKRQKVTQKFAACRRPVPEPGLRAGGFAGGRGEGARARGEDVRLGDPRRRAEASLSATRSSSRRCSRRSPCRRSATPRRSKSVRTR